MITDNEFRHAKEYLEKWVIDNEPRGPDPAAWTEKERLSYSIQVIADYTKQRFTRPVIQH